MPGMPTNQKKGTIMTSRREFLIAAAAAACLTAGPARAQSEITVGAVVPITGAFAPSGIQYYNSLRMAEEDINAAGGIGDKKFKILFEDTQASNPTAVNAFVKLVKQNSLPFIFLSSLSTQNLATEPEVLKAKVPTFYGGGSVAVQERKNPYMFRLRPPDSLAAEALAAGVKLLLNKSKPGILYTQDDYGLGLANMVDAGLIKVGITPVGREAFSPRDNDFSAQILSLKNKGADSILCFTYNRDGALILKQRLSLGLDLPFLCGSAMVAPSTLQLVEPAETENLFAVADTVLGEAISPASADFVKRYTAKYGFAPDPYGAAYYDGAMIVADALRKVGPDPEKVRGYLAALKDYKGLARTYSTDEAQNLANDVVLVKFSKGGVYTAVTRYPAKP
jgi:branched-chain amino acid transport system substrate-binding protein